MGQEVASTSFQCGWVPEQKDYNIVLLNGSVTFDADGKPSVDTVTATAYVCTNGERTVLPVNSASGAQHNLYFVASSIPAVAMSQMGAANLVFAKWARFDLVAKSDVGQQSSYQPSAVLASKSIALCHDGQKGDPGNPACALEIVPNIIEVVDGVIPNPASGMAFEVYINKGGVRHAPTQLNLILYHEGQSGNGSSWTAVDSSFGVGDNLKWRYYTANGKFGYQFKGSLTDSLTVPFSCVFEDQTYEGELQITVVPSGKDAVNYQLVVNPTSVRYDLNSTASMKYSSGNIKCYVNKAKGESTTQVMDLTAEGLTLRRENYHKADGADTLVESNAITLNSSGYSTVILSAVQYSRIDFVLRKGDLEIARESVSVVEDGKNGTTGKNGVWVPPPMVWDDYTDGYEFKCGNINDGETHMDIVIAKVVNSYGETLLKPRRCRVSHTKSNDHNPATDVYDETSKPNGYWEATDIASYKFLATDLLLANQAYIDFLSGQSIRVGYRDTETNKDKMCGYFGAPINGGAIFYSGGDNVGDATYVVNKDGLLRIGNAQGKRIVLNPANQSLEAYGADNSLCYSLSGNEINVNNPVPSGIDMMGGSLSEYITFRKGSDDEIAEDDYEKTVRVLLLEIPSSAITKDGELKVNVPKLWLNPAFFGVESTNTTSLRVDFSLEVGSSLAKSKFASVTRDYQTGSNVETTQGSTDAFQWVVPNVPAGSTVQLFADVTAQYYGTFESAVTAHAYTTSFVTAHFSADGMMTRFGKNGVVISLNSDNYFYALFGNGKMHTKIVSNGVVMFDTDTNEKHF